MASQALLMPTWLNLQVQRPADVDSQLSTTVFIAEDTICTLDCVGVFNMDEKGSTYGTGKVNLPCARTHQFPVIYFLPERQLPLLYTQAPCPPFYSLPATAAPSHWSLRTAAALFACAVKSASASTPPSANTVQYLPRSKRALLGTIAGYA
jgi:hypothetical protein